MFIYAVAIGLIIGKVGRGKFERIGYVNIRLPFLIILSFLIQVSIFMLNVGLVTINDRLLDILLVSSYISIIIAMLANLRIRYMVIVLTGAVFNFIMVILNGLRIGLTLENAQKVYSSEIVQLLKADSVRFFKLIPQEKSIMGGIIPFNKFFVYPSVATLGDLLIFAGIILIIQQIMTDKNIRKGRNFGYSKGLFR
ncbi:hypothetical protein SAMN02745751_02618 [Dethiosulfatibacter aminovorans DSM 17477]|uniref:DUF5317 domain-containing protein n=1 Tax=Dethiosulfatibacter aminovorans DSM 17477 TaxID=1121476 RepID=A0A1M6JG74_9FIRM|nr:DUF5317 family protein [Dethiosulfatibacter aminovorans]SHJ45703.1 hypothetical protein SAMN02745751_02618 [Dethiosulfatibacter aminovorans DSM 17477]